MFVLCNQHKHSLSQSPVPTVRWVKAQPVKEHLVQATHEQVVAEIYIKRYKNIWE